MRLFIVRFDCGAQLRAPRGQHVAGHVGHFEHRRARAGGSVRKTIKLRSQYISCVTGRRRPARLRITQLAPGVANDCKQAGSRAAALSRTRTTSCSHVHIQQPSHLAPARNASSERPVWFAGGRGGRGRVPAAAASPTCRLRCVDQHGCCCRTASCSASCACRGAVSPQAGAGAVATSRSLARGAFDNDIKVSDGCWNH